MSLDKSIQAGKEYRKPYRHAQSTDKTCRCHGGCPYCLGNRMHSFKVERLKMQQQVEELIDDGEVEKKCLS